ncbi:integral membrane sensor signal transduction histidine kinase [Neobacillus bataviensis LMG 21833]|uniref:histidine kinase n=1 Tax=Neobacillus bataviensis LMG 21833 TaxID=1117379 RepID=K6D2L7_9BACI|nr:histidine kinase [Neobacillus bataviensis]EKN66742.1 integral membrane sensor signal transduction histidine kinase [Neobacillus bataviensis LMG 21833]
MLFRIRSKLLLYFIVLVVLLTSVGFIFYNSSEKLVNEYDNSFERFLLLNDISQRTNVMTEKLHAYILDKEESYLKDYRKEKVKLIRDQKRLYKEMNTNDITLINYKNMIDSFLDEGDATVGAFQKDDINHYSNHFNEVLKIAAFLQESTLALLNNKLTDYQNFYDQMEKQNHYYKLMSLSLFAAAFFLSTLLALWISGGITKPISLLSKAAKEISKGNLSGADIKITTKDELKPLTETFNQMRTNLRHLVTEIKQKSELDKLLKELELRSLQNQINPHFLFNTLNTVSKMAYLEEAEQTSRLIVSVAALLRYNLSDFNKASTLREEVRIVKEYFFIQQTRFGERIEFVTDIDDSCLDIEIPSLILQPLVENAFIHGVESYEENAEIRLHIYRQQDRIHVEVIDNGDGMDESTKKRLLTYVEGTEAEEISEPEKSKGHSTGIGVKNVIRRLQLFYQRNDIVEIESELKKGTNFRLTIPNVAKGGS